MPAYGEIEITVRSLKFENALMFERESSSEACMALTRQFQMGIDNVDAEYLGTREKFGKPRSGFCPCHSRHPECAAPPAIDNAQVKEFPAARWHAPARPGFAPWTRRPFVLLVD